MRRHPLHSICPYFAMFPEGFVERHVLAYTKVGDNVFDPFCGRGTTVFQSLLMGRQAAGVDINPVAACISGAKARPPLFAQVVDRLKHLEEEYKSARALGRAPSLFFEKCFHRSTLRQLFFLREKLNWRRSTTDRFIAAMVLGALHGESHRSEMCLSNRMPRTISTKPEYSVRWWNERGLEPPQRDVFRVLDLVTCFRFKVDPAKVRGTIRLADGRRSHSLFPALRGAVKLVVTSPPYLDVTDYAEDQWLRLWFLGGDPFPVTRKHRDDRITDRAIYWKFLRQVWSGMAPLLNARSMIVVRIGGRLSVEELSCGLQSSLEDGLVSRRVRRVQAPITSAVSGRQTNNFRPGAGPSFEHDFVFAVS
jgi:hypothetical protein